MEYVFLYFLFHLGSMCNIYHSILTTERLIVATSRNVRLGLSICDGAGSIRPEFAASDLNYSMWNTGWTLEHAN
jgi:hypothetical protein